LHATLWSLPTKLLQVPIKALEFSEELDVGEISIENADRIVGIARGNESIAGVLNGFQMAGRDVSADTGYGKITGHIISIVAGTHFWLHGWVYEKRN
jgi:hypothetical protein